MTQLKFYKSPWKALKLFCGSSLFTSFGVWIILNRAYGTYDYKMGWLTTVFFGLGIIVSLAMLIDRRPKIIITESGIWDRASKENEIKWEQIIAIHAFTINTQQFIGVKVTEDFVFRKKPKRLLVNFNKLIGAEKINVTLSNLQVDTFQFEQLMNRMVSSPKEQRMNLIRNYSSERKLNSGQVSVLKECILYGAFISVLITITFAVNNAFIFVMIPIGIAAVVSTCYSRWYPQGKSRFVRYCNMVTYIGFFYMIILFWIIQLKK